MVVVTDAAEGSVQVRLLGLVAVVAYPDRITDAIPEPAVLRRLHALPAEERTAWSARFETLSLASLDASGSDAAQLARIERDLPLTSGAARAALRLA